MSALRALRTRERGSSIVAVLGLSFVILAVGAGAVRVAEHQGDMTAHDRLREQAFAAAEAGVNEAVSHLTTSSSTPWSTTGTLVDGSGRYAVTVTAVSTDPDDPRRLLTSTGFAPAGGAAPDRVARRIEQRVVLHALDGFNYALFATDLGLTSANRMTVHGDVYSKGDLDLANNAVVFGDVNAVGSISTTNKSTITGDVRAGGNIDLYNSQTTVHGNVASGGDVVVDATVEGDAEAAGSVSVTSNGEVLGEATDGATPITPESRELPTFTWDPDDYPLGTTSSWTTTSDFEAYWDLNRGAFSGHHRITDPAQIDFDKKWTLTGDTTIVSDGPVHLTRDIDNDAGEPVTLVIVSDTTEDPAIVMSNNLSLPDDITVVFFAPNSRARFTQLKHFSGAVYAKGIDVAQQFTLTFEPADVPGFDWDLSSSTHFRIEAGVFREVPES